MDFVANFDIETVEFDAVLEVNPAGAVWGNIQGNIADQTDLTDLIDTKIDIEATARGNADDVLDGKIGDNTTAINNHIADKTNPHEVTKAQVGLGNVDNTSDLNKPISTATQNALDGKQPTITGGASTIVSNDLTTGRALISNSNGKVDVSDITATELGYLDGATSNIQSQIGDITDLIPANATTSNQLADKEFVNSSISTNTAKFIGTFIDVPTLEAYSGTVTNNDYAFVVNSVITDGGNDWATYNALNAYDKSLLTNFDYAWVVNGSNFDLYRFDILNQQWDLRVSNTPKTGVTLNVAYNRYKATVSGTTVTWEWEFTLNNSSFTAAQWAAINSLITAETKVTHTANTAVGNSTTPVYVGSDGAVSPISYTIEKSVPNYAEFTDTTYTIATGSSNGTISVAVDGGTPNDVSVYGLGSAAYTNSSAYATSSQGTKADSAIQSVKINGSALTPDANKAVNITVPTDTGDLTNNAGFITSSALSGYQTTSNLVTSISSLSTDTQYPSAKCVYDIIGDIESLLSQV